MFYNHKEFDDHYEVNPHKINFGKDRDTLQIGSTLYTAKIRRYVKDTKTSYTLQLTKGQQSPLFVPYKEDIFLVLEPLNKIQTVEPVITTSYKKTVTSIDDYDDGKEDFEEDQALADLF